MTLQVAFSKSESPQYPMRDETPSSVYTFATSGFVYSVVSYMTSTYLAVSAAPILPSVEVWKPESFNLDLSGVAAIVGGEEAVAATVAAFTTGNTWCIAPYTPPGAYVVAKYFGKTINGTVWKGIFPGERIELNEALSLHRPSKYQYYGLLNGTRMKPVSNIPDCLIDESLISEIKGTEKKKNASTGSDQGNNSPSFLKTALDTFYKNLFPQSTQNKKDRRQELVRKLCPIPYTTEDRGSDNSIYIFQAEEGWKGDEKKIEAASDKLQEATQNGSGAIEKAEEPAPEVRIKPNRKHVAVGLVAFVLNIGILIFLGLVNDWYAFGVIAGSMVGNFCFMGSVGACRITAIRHKPKSSSLPPGHGIFTHETNNVFIAVFGTEKAVNGIAKTYLKVEPKSPSSTRWIGLSCILMQLVFLAQLLMTPQATYTGQVCFLVALLIGWFANAYYSALDATRAQRVIVEEHAEAKLVAILTGNRTVNLITLAFLTGIHGAGVIKVYESLLAQSPAWTACLNYVSKVAEQFDNGVPPEELNIPENVKGLHMVPDLVAAHKAALKLRGDERFKTDKDGRSQDFLSFLNTVKAQCSMPSQTNGGTAQVGAEPHGNTTPTLSHRSSNPSQQSNKTM
jgi:hypothetical protein